MSQLRKTVLSHLQELSQQAPLLTETDQTTTDPLIHTSTLEIASQNGSVNLTVEFADISRYSMLLCGLQIAAGAPVPISPADDIAAYLTEQAEHLIQSLNYLEEPLTICELDVRERAVQLRSALPERDGEQITYWEVLLQVAETPSLTMARYTWAPGMTERERVAYPATFVLVARIAESVCAICQQQ